VILCCIRAQHLRGPRGEICHDRIDRYPAPGNKNTGLTGGTKIGGDAAPAKSTDEPERCVLFSESAICADGE
jgi:hypothetical protein